MTDKHSKYEEKVDQFFRKIAEEAEELPVRTIDIPAINNDIAGICLIAEDRHPAAIDEIAAAISADSDNNASSVAPRKTTPFALQESLSIEIERARFTSTSLTLVLMKTTAPIDETLSEKPLSILKNALHRVDIVTWLEDDIAAILMPETSGHAAEIRGAELLASLGDITTGCGIYSSFGKDCPEPEVFLRSALQELEKSCTESGIICRNEYEEPASCQVTVEEKSELFNLFGKDKS